MTTFVPSAPNDPNGRLDWTAIENLGQVNILTRYPESAYRDPDGMVERMRKAAALFNPETDAVLVLNGDHITNAIFMMALQEQADENGWTSWRYCAYQRNKSGHQSGYNFVPVSFCFDAEPDADATPENRSVAARDRLLHSKS